MVVISIEGNVGAGKSTLLKKLKDNYPEFNYVPEPVDTWMEVKDKNDNNILKLFYLISSDGLIHFKILHLLLVH